MNTAWRDLVRGQHVRIAYEILTDGRRWLGHPHGCGRWAGIALGGVPAAGREHVANMHIYILGGP